ncbi:TPT-domain-containing protein [Dichomitus squalens]|uniref:TPT-domain-containing protein n=1 Tax=Dichomitus squalens TaxID=114155 RepID=A0A4Q9MG74_9APHY|nr:TPT-domain-containing protein [Dichomitus squalens]
MAKATKKRRLLRARHWADSQAVWLGLYFAFNLCLTLYNKGVLVRFPFPYTLTAVHALFGSIGGRVLREKDAYIPAQLSVKSWAVLVAFSVLYSVNIAVSNLSLQLVTIPFHQVLRAATPIFTTVIATTLLGIRFSNRKIVTLFIVMLGVALATYGDYYFTTFGFLLTLLGTFLAALKTIYTNILQSSSTSPSINTRSPFVPPPLHLHPLDLLTRLSPLAFIQCVAYAYLSGELGRIRSVFVDGNAPPSAAGWWYPILLLGNGFIAFGLNVVSFTANGKVGALNMTVAANVKQVLTILLSVAIFDLTITRTNALGIFVTIVGGAWYAWVEQQEKASRTAEKSTSGR